MRSLLGTLARALVPITVAVVAVVAAVVAVALPAPDQGLHLAYENGQVVVASVDYGTTAQRSGIRPGDVVVELYSLTSFGNWSLDDHPVLLASDQIKRDVPNWRGPWAEVVTVRPDQVAAEAVAQSEMAVINARDSLFQAQLAPWTADGNPVYLILTSGSYPVPPDSWYFLDVFRSLEPAPIALGLAVLILGWWLVGSGRAGTALRPYALTLPVATAVPLLVVPIDRYLSLPATIAGSLLVPLAMLPLAMDFLGCVEGRRRRWLVASIAFGLALGSVAAGILAPAGGELYRWRAVLAAGVAFVPGFFAARPFHRPKSGASVAAEPTPRALIQSTDLALAAVTPGIACVSLAFTSVPYSYTLWPIVVWLAAILIARRFALRPLARLATLAARQRDLEMAAAEAERARIAGEIHDDALQELTMLVRRLDAAGDVGNAEAARGIAVRLRAICGDLRLPILDDLGVGPSLEWFVDRLDRVCGPIGLEREGEDRRLPDEVELAVYRIAQEALVNAVKHGEPPIVVRYTAGPSGVELEVDDAGAGLAPGAADLAERTGRLGLIGMAQRAEAIGAVLSVGQRPGGGTRVKLIWNESRAEATAEAALAPAGAPAPGTP